MIRRATLALAVVMGTGCVLESPPAPESLDEAFFRCEVEPVLAGSCAFHACHGAPERPFRLYAPNRLRLDVPEESRAIALTDAERDHNRRAALRFAQPAPGYEEPLLVVKPLDQALGGAFHRGALDYGGGDVFTEPDDAGLEAIRAWLRGATEDTSCAAR